MDAAANGGHRRHVAQRLRGSVQGGDAGDTRELPAGLAAEPGLRAAACGCGGQAGRHRGGVCRYRVVVEGLPQAAGGVATGVVGRERGAGWVNG
ncbi:hypothetical protein G6F60_015056 [Rhizopus arrhizus]|nr:hypothetical protein G6F60_015056 [Rhizopus arrhizus]